MEKRAWCLRLLLCGWMTAGSVLLRGQPSAMATQPTTRPVLSATEQKKVEDLQNRIKQLRTEKKLKEIVPLSRQALEIHRDVLGEMNPQTLSSMRGLAAALKDCGQLEEAEQLSRQALELN